MLRICFYHCVLSLFVLSGLMCVSTNLTAGPYAALVAEIDSERPLFQRNADELRHPASLTKMMTLYLVFESLARGEINKQTRFRASRFAVLRPPSRMGLLAGHSITVEQGILALVTRSANDAAATLAEGLGGSESAFAYLMNEKARRLGMTRTVFRNASGLPDPRQVTTAWDMFHLAKALHKHFPQYYDYFSTSNFEYEGQNFGNHNHLLKSYPGADGIKTGFVNASGFNLVASARREGRRLIGVVFGGNTAAQRDTHMRDILDDGFDQLEGRESRLIRAPFDQPEHYALLHRPSNHEEFGDAPERYHAYAPSAETGKAHRVHAIQLGQFATAHQAEQRISMVLRLAPLPLHYAQGAVIAHRRHKKTGYLAQLRALNQQEAQKVCLELKRKKLACSVIR